MLYIEYYTRAETNFIDEKFYNDQKPKEYFSGLKSNGGIFRVTIYLFNPWFFNQNPH
jgi:hypothetical protein